MPRSRKPIDAIRLWSIAMTVVVCAAVAGAIFYLLAGSIPAMRAEGWSFFSTARWHYRQGQFGAAAMLFGSLSVAALALILATPIATLAAVFISEMCARRVRIVLKVAVELLAGIPSVVYGLLGVLYLREWVYQYFDTADTIFTASLLLTLMVVPTITTLAEDALHAVPAPAREASRGLGLTRAETIVSVVVPRAMPGMIGAVLLGFGRAIGETIAVFLVVGRADNQPLSLEALFGAGQTITSKLGGSEVNIAVGDATHTSALLALAALLLTVVLAVTFVAETLRHRMTA